MQRVNCPRASAGLKGRRSRSPWLDLLSISGNCAYFRLWGSLHRRNSWLFFGSDDHASAAANLFSLIASCKLHHLDPEPYFTEVFRVMPYWPRDRYLELAPKYWAATRARLDASELARPIGHITVPPVATKEQAATN